MRSKNHFKKRTNKKKTLKKRNNKISGGDPKFTVMSFNVECWLNQLDKNFFKNFIENNDTSILSKWQQLKDIFDEVDIACIQENAVIKQRDGSFKNFINKIGDLNLISSCQSHNFHWPQTQGLYGVGSKISNSIYAKYGSPTDSPLESQLTIDGIDTIDTYIDEKKEKHPRCWAISEIPINGKKVKVASIHLSGGRFDDIASLTHDNYLVKTNQIHKLLEEEPDIVCGDLNTKLVRPKVDDYFKGLPKPEDKASTTVSTRTTKSIADKWDKWMYGLDEVFKKFGYISVFEGRKAPDTSIFGGTVDMIYYNPKLLTCSDSYAVDGAMEPGKRILSDHAPIKAVFAFIPVKI
jgi:endonuclease/exonuclease/phosphatase family metal-dependent hydrolase